MRQSTKTTFIAPGALVLFYRAALPLSRQEKELLGSVGATAVGAGRDALSTAAGVLREEVAHADLGAKVSDLADKMVQGVTNGSPKT